jgi:pyruvate kinase
LYGVEVQTRHFYGIEDRKLKWYNALDFYISNASMRLTKIICTLGPSSSNMQQVRDLADNGMNIARINLSHGSRKEHTESISILKDLNADCHCIGILLDTRGAEIRTGDTSEATPIKKGEEVLFSPDPDRSSSNKVILVNYSDFANDVRETDRILIDNGTLSFDIVSIEDNGDVLARASQNGSIGSRRHINLPGADIDLPSITKHDWEDIAFAIEQNVDFLALSFIRTAQEVEEVRAFLKKKKSSIRIITKIETEQAVENIVEIIRVSDGIMVARGDLGADLPFECLPVVQDEIVCLCRDRGIPVIVATHMLESMKDHPMPTRAEVTDVAHAAVTGADSTMLSGETASGQYPVLSLQAMCRILLATESHIARFSENAQTGIQDDKEACGDAAANLAQSSDASALLVVTRSGETAQDVSKFRPHIPIIALTDNETLQQQLQLVYGVYPLLVSLGDDPEQAVEHGIKAAKKHKLIEKGQKIVIVSDTKTHKDPVSSVQVREVE